MLEDYQEVENRINTLLTTFETISIKGLDKVSLLNRIDVKYAFHIHDFEAILEEIRDNYMVLEIKDQRLFDYESVYFDTEDFLLYKHHHNGKLNRMKVRIRKYVDSNIHFFEVKYKVKATRTDKRRVKRSNMDRNFSEAEQAIVNYPQITADDLKEKLTIFYKRITLVSKKFNERLTLDVGLRYHAKNDKTIAFQELIVAEIKTDKTSFSSPILKSLKARHMEQIKMSKYSLGVALLEDIKSNNLKPSLLKIQRIITKWKQKL